MTKLSPMCVGMTLRNKLIQALAFPNYVPIRSRV